jgi:D-alanyl-D-alanine carboxypeptidase (penicillin-binding protein 5/6)
MVPDPHPPLGGVGPDGTHPGGAALQSRGVVKPRLTAPLPASLTAQGWILVDLDSGDVLAAKDAHGRYQPASILKLLTTVTLLPLLPGNRAVRVSNAAATAEGSRAGLVAGGTYTIDQLFSGLLLVSGNDTAAALADAAGGYQHTVDLMNAEARSLGAYDTVVQTPSGLDGWQQLTSAYDMALVLRAAMQQPRFVKYDRQLQSKLPWQRINGYGPVTLWNQNSDFLTSVPGALVAKTGYTDAAQHTFVGAMSKHGHRLGVVFMRAQRYPTDQWQQAVDLMNWGFALRAGAAPVGHLDSPVTPQATRSASSSQVAVLLKQHPVKVGGTDHAWVYPVGGGVLLLAIAPLVLGVRRRPSRPSRPSGPSRPSRPSINTRRR